LKVIAFTELCSANFNDPKKTLEILMEMNRFCEKIENKRDKALGLRKIGTIYGNLNYIDRALEYTFKSAELFEKLNDKFGLAYCYNNIGVAYNSKGSFTGDKRFLKRSIEYLIKSIDLRDPLKDTVPLQMAYDNIGSTYITLGDYDKALEYLKLADQYAEHIGDRSKIEATQSNLASCYINKGIEENNPVHFKHALVYLHKLMKSYDEKSTEDIYSFSLAYIGYVYCKTGNSSLGISYLQKGLNIAKENKNKSSILDFSLKLSEAYEKNGDYANALEMLHLHNINKDSLINEKNSSSIEEMQVLYQSSQKDREIEKLNNEKIVKDAELSRQRTIIISSIGAALSILILVLVLWSRFNLKKKANEQLGDAYRKIELKNQQITDSINYSKRIQTAILPPVDLLNKHLHNFFIYYAPKDIVSGDFYWFSEHNNHLFFIVVDCTGHGVPGALMSMIGNTLLNEIINQKNITEPGEILNHLNKGVKHALRQGGSDVISQDDGMDVSICCVDRANPRVLKYATANHSIFIKANGKVTELVGDIFSIGGDFGSLEKAFENKSHSLEPNSFVVMSTDGFYDQFGGDKDSKFLVSRFENLILNTDLQATNCAEQFEKSLLQWKGLQKQTDDVLVAGFKI
jgi:serine phosphatase RsbU (regulator of sigma subunit)/TPR repeat protein